MKGGSVHPQKYVAGPMRFELRARCPLLRLNEGKVLSFPLNWQRLLFWREGACCFWREGVVGAFLLFLCFFFGRLAMAPIARREREGVLHGSVNQKQETKNKNVDENFMQREKVKASKF